MIDHVTEPAPAIVSSSWIGLVTVGLALTRTCSV